MAGRVYRTDGDELVGVCRGGCDYGGGCFGDGELYYVEGSPGESGGGAERGIGEREIVLGRWIYEVFGGLPGFRQAVLFYGGRIAAG